MTPSGLSYSVKQEGTGKVAKSGDIVSVHYTGWILHVDKDGNKTVGDEFDSSVARGTPFNFVLGEHTVIPGWEEGVASMRVGETRELDIPPALAYGASGMPQEFHPMPRSVLRSRCSI